MILTNKKYKLETKAERILVAAYVSEWLPLPKIKAIFDLGCSDSMWYKYLQLEGLIPYRYSHTKRVAAAKIVIAEEEEVEAAIQVKLAIEALGA